MPWTNMDTLRLHNLMGTFNRQSKVYPTMAATPTISSGSTAWVLGNFTELVPSNAITVPFKIDYMSFAAFSAVVTLEVILYKGLSGSEVEIARIRINPGATTATIMAFPIFSKGLNANERISVRIASAGTGIATFVTSIVYHNVD